MQREQIVNLIIEKIKTCADENLLDLIYKLLIESSY